MRRGMARFAAWLAVTAAAVALSWYGVRTVLRGTVFEAPRAPALAANAVRGPAPDPATLLPAPEAAVSIAPETTAPTSSRPTASASPRPTSARPSSDPPSSSAPPSTSRAADPPDGDAADAQAPVIRVDADPGGQAGSTQGFELKGGRAAFTFTPTAATLIAATPHSGWSVKVHEGGRWLRVDFTRGARTSSVFVSWIAHPPLAVTYES
ncbi:hypothetical protein LO772_26275 [Yinghuangia sp. ASG 101]|uniref:hypothetical protein n=1 Tax=Yinghuangia sp. ASG 101 TaxID=2896848 RepID=UPI001E62AF76|nr:hypothetical protein [Yinghuangia sp. ASG 101]UGQ10346.1 hypothetical protein LO772_26275 [Yinghuangia sp. ASG 101]